jgi:outer membrane protein TolC
MAKLVRRAETNEPARKQSTGSRRDRPDHQRAFTLRRRARRFVSTLVLPLSITARASADDGAGPDDSFPTTLAPTRVIRLREALAYAKVHQPSLRAALDRVAAARVAAQIPRAGWLPVAGAEAEFFAGTANNTTALSTNVPEVDLPRIGATRTVDRGSWVASPSTLAAVSVGQELFDFGRIAAESVAADANVKTERYRADAERLAIDLVVKESFFGVQGAKAVLRAAKDAYERTLVHSQMADAGVRTGLYAPIERTRAQADLARFEVNRMRAQGGLMNAQVVLAAAVGTPERMLDADDDVTPVPPLPSLDHAIAAGTTRDPVVLQGQARLLAQQARTRAISAEMRPDLALSGTFSGRAGGADPSSGVAAGNGGWVPNVPNWDVGLVLRVPLYDGVIASRQRASAAQEKALSSELDAIAQQELSAIQQACVTARVARAQLGSLQRAVEAARANYAQAEARFKAGLGTALELADAEYLRTEAEIQLAGGQFELSRTRAVLGKLMAEES